MKSLTFLTFIALLTLSSFTQSFAGNYSPEERCREILKVPTISPDVVSNVKADLISGKWMVEQELLGSSQFQSSNTNLYFYNYGMADLVSTDPQTGIQLITYLWRVEKFGEEPFLVLTSKEGRSEKLFKVEQTCKGINLTNAVSGEKTTMVFQKIKEEKELNGIKFNLTGSWDCMTYPFDITTNTETCGTFEKMEGAYLKYEMKEDGTYTKNLGTDQMDVEEKGFWEVSEDGQYIIFHAAKRGNAEEIFATYVAQVSHLNYGEMVLKQALHGTGEFDTLFCTDIKTFFFNKA
ncbi:MAG: hypothetical protein KDC24_11940 [Saprospiraceae bacterium]|nr:hypothetical protein [Saprospiraceae bacterium]